jgi:hypothetical protein
MPGRKSALLGGFLQAGLLGDLGSLPKPAAGVPIGAGVEGREGWSVVLTGAFVRKTRGTSDEVSGVGGEFRLRTATVAGCQAAHASPTSLQICLGSEVGPFRAEGVDGDWSEVRRHVRLAPRADAGAQLHLGRASAVVSVGAVVPLVRKEYVMDNAGRIHQPSWLAESLPWPPGTGSERPTPRGKALRVAPRVFF